MEQRIITLAVLSYERAEVLKSLLEIEEIECFLENVNLIQGAVSSGVKVKIKENDLDKAMPLLESMMQESSEVEAINKTELARILLPVDFSDYSQKAADFAFDWAQVLKAEITIFHAYYDPVITAMPFSDGLVYDMNLDEMVKELKEKAQEGMAKMVGYLKKKNQLKENRVVIKSVIVKGVAEEEIVRFSNSYHPFVIVMGTRGLDRKATDLIGSVTSEVIDIAKVPVLAIPEDFDYKGLESLRNVLYVTNFDEADFKAIEILEKVWKPLGVKIICAHVGPSKHSKWDEMRLEGLREHIRKTYQESDVVCDFIDNEDFLVGIERFVQQNEIDCISITTHRRNIIARLLNPSIAKKMLFHSTTPLLVFHA